MTTESLITASKTATRTLDTRMELISEVEVAYLVRDRRIIWHTAPPDGTLFVPYSCGFDDRASREEVFEVLAELVIDEDLI